MAGSYYSEAHFHSSGTNQRQLSSSKYILNLLISEMENEIKLLLCFVSVESWKLRLRPKISNANGADVPMFHETVIINCELHEQYQQYLGNDISKLPCLGISIFYLLNQYKMTMFFSALKTIKSQV